MMSRPMLERAVLRAAVLFPMICASAACSSGSSGPRANTGGAGGAGTGGTSGAGGPSNIGVGTAFPAGIGTDWKWNANVVAHTDGPYAPCGIIGTGPITFGAANPTVSEFAAASQAGAVLFYSLTTGKQVRAPHFAAGAVNSVDYSRDGTKLVVAGDAGVEIVRLADDKVLFTIKPFEVSTRAASLSPDGALLAVLGWDGTPEANQFTLRLIQVSDATSIGTSAAYAPDGVVPQFAPDGKLLVVGGMLLSVPALEVLPPSPLGFSGTSPPHAAMSPDGTKIAEGGHVLDIASGRALKTPLPDDNRLYWSAFSPDGTVYAETDDAIHLWRTSDWTPIGAPTPIPVASDTLNAGADGRFFFSGDGARLIATVHGDIGPAFQIMNLPDLTAGPTIAEPQLADGPVVLSPDGSLVVGSLGITAEVWQTADLAPVQRLSESSTAGVVGFLGNGMLQLGSTVFDPLAGTKLGLGIGSAVSPDGRLAVVSLPGQKWSVIRLADLGTQVAIDASGFASSLPSVWAFSRDNHVVAAAGKDPNGHSKVIVFDAMTGAMLATLAGAPPIAIATTPNGAVRVAAFVPAGEGFESDVRVWSVPGGQALFDIKQATAKNWAPGADVPTMAFSPDGSLIAAGAAGIRIFQVDSGALRETLPAHFDTRRDGSYWGTVSLAFSATGQIVSVGWDSTMRFWCSP